MQSKPSSHKLLVTRVIIYLIMFITVVIMVTLITMLMLGFRLTAGNLERYAFLQFNSNPTGATVSIDGALVGAKTPNKSSTPSGKHDIVIWRDGYSKWSKTVDVKPGTLTWLDYAILVPTKLDVKSVKHYEALNYSLASPKTNNILIQEHVDLPVFDLVDISSDDIKSKILTLPVSSYSEAQVPGVSHSFRVSKWDKDGRYVLIDHLYQDKNEWLVLDTKNPEQTKNITQLLDIKIDKIDFSGNSGNSYYILASNDVRKIDLSAATISKPLVSRVASFDFYEDSKVITYKTVKNSDTNLVELGIYLESNDIPSVVKTAPADVSSSIVATRYFNEDYVATLIDTKIDVFKGSYSSGTATNSSSLKSIKNFYFNKPTGKLSFSPNGQFIFVQAESDFTSYDLEYRKRFTSKINGLSDMSSLRWLDDNYIWSDRDGQLTIREFDGQNIHTINQVITGQDVVMTKNKRYIYSINKSATGYQLQRVRITL